MMKVAELNGIDLETDGMRTRYGVERLARVAPQSRRIAIRRLSTLGPEAFTITSDGDETVISGGDDSGAMYGCLELAKRINEPNLGVDEKPQFTLRGPCIGMQKTFILPGRKVYEYPYTNELFPFFYDRAFWAKYLDMLVDNRFNTLYLWSGHPFASLVRLDDYPDAIEVSPEQLDENMSTLRWIAGECDRRGIWLVQGFYSLLMPKPLADKHGFDTQLAAPNPVASDYTRKAIAKFIELYPSVGLKVCLGEALQGQDNQNYWLLDVILPGVKDGMAAAGLMEEPPIVIRTHATDLRKVLPQALKIYGNIHTEAKFNGESLTTHEPRGKRQEVHRAMAAMAKSHLINVHILANLEPFRYGAQRFIRECIRAGRDRLDARGLHLYPLAYWSWPDAPDAAPLEQIERDWIWFEAWARYAWNSEMTDAEDRAYWLGRLASLYGEKAAPHILDAYNDSGECAPRLLRRFGITEGNRQTLSLGMTLDQLVNPARHRPFEELWESQAPPGERLKEYVDREWAGEPHEGETPVSIIEECEHFAAAAQRAIEAAAPAVTDNREEFERIRNDVHCIAAMTRNYAEKVRAAIHVLRYQHSKDIADMDTAAKHLAASLEHYRTLAKLTEGTYRFANTMQTNQRKVPFNGGVDGQPVNYHWTQCLPLYEQELADFRNQLEDIRSGKAASAIVEPLPAAKVKILSGGELFPLREYERVFADRPWQMRTIAAELQGLKGVRVKHEGTPVVEFESTDPVQVLIGYVKSPDDQWLKVPDLETDAGAADDHGGLDPSIQNAVAIDSTPPVDVHVLQYPAGRQTLTVRGSGSFLVLGFVPAGVTIAPRDARQGVR
jgi:hypothetical protein